MTATVKPQLSVPAFTLAVEDPGTWQPLLDWVRAADRAGVDRVVLSGEHVVFGENLEAYGNPDLGGTAGGKQITGPDGCYLEPMTTTALLSGITSQVRFITNILLAALRRPIVLAKSAATLDVLSAGRLDLGVGVGWQREEYEAAGLDFESRGRVLDHTLEVCQTLWRERRATYSSPELHFEGIHMMPKPLDPNGVPIWVSGSLNPRAMRRLARFGTGWIPWGEATLGTANLLETIPKMREAVAGYGRDPAELQIAGSLPIVREKDGNPSIGPTMEGVAALREGGVTDFRALLLPTPGDPGAAEDYLSRWVEAFRAATA